MTAGKRMPRVNEALRHELAMLLEEEIVPLFPGVLVTLMEVQTAPDLRDAIVRVSVMGPSGSKPKVLQALQKERVRLQHDLGRRIKLKFTPRLDFRIDETVEKGFRVLSILSELEPELGKPSPDDDAETPRP
jgi:ribosome-binding factor A